MKKFFATCIAIIIFTAALPVLTTAESKVVQASADATISRHSNDGSGTQACGASDHTYSAQLVLSRGENRLGLVHFTLPALPEGEALTSAMLTIYTRNDMVESSVNKTIKVACSAVDSIWNETTLTYNQAEEGGYLPSGYPITGLAVPLSKNSMLTIDVTELLSAEYAAKKTNTTFVLAQEGTTSGNDIVFRSKEAGSQFTPTLTIASQVMSDDETTVQQDRLALDLGDTTNVTKNLILPAEGAGGSTITWNSDNPGLVSASGTVIRPVGEQDSDSTVLTAVLTKGVARTEKNFTVTVLNEKYPIDDTYTMDKNVIYGSAAVLCVRGDANRIQTFLKFLLPTIPEGQMVKRAALYLYKTNTGAGSYTIRRVADDWDESNVAHNVFIPADEGMETASWTIDADKDQYVSCDISSLVSTCYAEGGANLNLAIGGTVGGSSSNTTIQFQSKEGIYKPYLAVEFEERTAQADVDAALRRLTLADTAQENIKLPTVGEYETVITWASSDTAVITEDGKVTRPAVNRPDAQITLTATISKTGAESRTKQFVITVLSNATPLEDSYIDPNNPDTAYGDAAQIFAKHRPQRIIAVKYDLSGLGELGDYAFASAKFKIYCTSTDVVPEEQVLLACSDNSWEEETLTWNTAENMRSETRIVAVGAASSAGDSWIEFDITDYANEKLLTRDKLMSFLLIATNEGEKASVYYQSKEADNKPVLEVELQPQSGMAVMYDYALNSDGTAQLTEGKLNIEAYYRNTTDADCSTRLLAAAYSSDGRMLRAFISEGAVAAAAGGGNASASLMLDTSGLSDIGYFRLFSWEGTATLRPYRQETIRVAAAS